VFHAREHNDFSLPDTDATLLYTPDALGIGVEMVPGLHGARFSNSTKIDILKFQKNSEKIS
jgi:hypothetical protein